MYIKLATKLFIRPLHSFNVAILFLFLLIFTTTNVSAQLDYNFERINTENGLPTNAIKGIQFDETTRFLWIATESGIVRYNGHEFQFFGENDNTAALNGRIVFFSKTINGKIFGKLIDERLFTIKNNKAVIDNTNYIMDDEKSYLNYKYNLNMKFNDWINKPIELSDIKVGNQLILKYDDTIYNYYNSNFHKINGSTNFDFEFTIDNQLFLVKKSGLFYKATINNNNIIINKLQDLYLLHSKGLKNNINNFKIFQNHPKESVYLVIGEKLFTIKYVNNNLTFNLITDKLPKNEFINYIQIDNVTNTIYIGTDNRGLLVGKPKYFNRILPSNAVEGVSTSAYAQLELANGNIQINSGQIFGNVNNTKSVFYKPAETNTFISRDSVLYMSNSDGLVEYDLKIKKIKNISNDINISRNSFIQIGDKIYSFNEKGIAVKYKKWQYVLQFAKMPFNFIVYSLVQINNREILAATTHGLYKYNIVHNSFNLFYRDNDNSNFRAIYNLNGYFLIGTYGGGVYMYYKDSIRKLPSDQNKYINYTHCFLLDKKGNIWASTNKGLFMSPSQSLIDFWKKGPGNIKFKYFGKNEGIDQLEMNGGCTPCAIKLSNEKFSFPGIDGLIQFNPDSIPSVDIQPKAYVDKLVLDENLVDIDAFNNDIPANIKNIDLELGISGMLSEENIVLEYKIDNDPWIRINVKNPIIKYSNPSYGRHNFSVRLKNTINDSWENLNYTFNVKYPWTLHPLMYIVYLLLIVGCIYLYIYFKTLIYRRRQQLLEKEVDAKTVELNEVNKYLEKRNQAKDHVIAIMNHDLLTPLKYLHITAKNIAETSKEEEIKSSIQQIAKTTKDLEFLTSNMLNWVKFDNIETLPQKQKVDLYALVENLVEFVLPFIQNKELKIINAIPANLIIDQWPDSLRVLLYNLIVNSIQNTIKGFITIDYNQTNNGYFITVSDTGVGMSSAMVNYLLIGNKEEEIHLMPKNRKGNGVGFQIIRNLIQLMRAKIDIESAENRGTKVTIFFTNSL